MVQRELFKRSYVWIGVVVGIVLVFPGFWWGSALARQPDTGSISGTAAYTGSASGTYEIIVAAHTEIAGSPETSYHLNTPGGTYNLTDVPDGDYYISAFVDLNSSGGGPPDMGEPLAYYDQNGDGTPDTVTVSGGAVTGADIEITDDPWWGTLTGTVIYTQDDATTEPVELLIFQTSNPTEPSVSFMIDQPGGDWEYRLYPGTYIVASMVNMDGVPGPPDPADPVKYYDADCDGAADEITVTEGITTTHIDMTLGDVIYVDADATGAEDGACWLSAYTDLQDALSAPESGDEIWVAEGTYTPGASRTATYTLVDGVRVYGGFDGTELLRSERDWQAYRSVLSGDIGTLGTMSDNVYHVISIGDIETTLDGFVIYGGRADGELQADKGGGILVNTGSPNLVNLTLINNYAINHGGGIAVQYTGADVRIINSTFTGNTTGANGAAITLIGGEVSLVNSTITGNSGPNGGISCLFGGSVVNLYNSIVWGNSGPELNSQLTGVISATYSLIEGGYVGTGNIDANPLFADANGADDVYGTLDDDVHLGANSPAIDAGSNSDLLADLGDSDGDGLFTDEYPLDFEGQNRRMDHGGVTDTGSGSAPIVDMGADEFAVLPIAGLSASSTSPAPTGQAVDFTAVITAGTAVSYTWEFGDGSTGSSRVTSHIYSEPGIYTASVTAENPLGSQSTDMEVMIYESFVLPPGNHFGTGDGVLDIISPPGIGETLTITYTPQAAPSHVLRAYEFAGLVFTLEAADSGGNPVIEPSMPYTMTVHYDESALPDGAVEAYLQLRRYDETASEWIALDVVTRDASANSLTVLLDCFSEFVLHEVEPAVVETDYLIYLPLITR